MPKISAIVITRNEADNIGACLDSLTFCAEKIVVDSDSTDNTAAIATAHGARVVTHSWGGFGPQKNFALSLATHDWVLSIDADERVTPGLATEIVTAVREGRGNGYTLSRRSTFCGRMMNHSGWSPDHVLRLFRRDQARFSNVPVHERVICSEPVLQLSEPLLHYPVGALEDALERMDKYSTASAEVIAGSERRVTFATGIVHGLWTFFRGYVLFAGFRDGREGFLLAVANAEGSYYRYMKAWLRQRDAAREEGGPAPNRSGGDA